MSEKKIYDARDYNRADDICWNVNRKFGNVSNYTFGPIADWEEEKINTVVDCLRNAIQAMIGHTIDARKKSEAAEAENEILREIIEESGVDADYLLELKKEEG